MRAWRKEEGPCPSLAPGKANQKNKNVTFLAKTKMILVFVRTQKNYKADVLKNEGREINVPWDLLRLTEKGREGRRSFGDWVLVR